MLEKELDMLSPAYISSCGSDRRPSIRASMYCAPMALNPDECQAMIDAARPMGRS